MLERLWLEVRQSFRGWRQSPGFVLLFVATIAVALGPTLVTASLLEAIVVRPVNASAPGRLYAISVTNPTNNQPGYVYADAFAALHSTQRSFSKLAMYSTRVVRVESSSGGLDGVLEGVTPEYFDALGAWPIAGRLFTNADRSSFPTAVISDRFRKRLFGNDASAIGKQLKVDGVDLAVIGVTPPGFAGLQFDGGTDLFVGLEVFQAVSRDRSRSVRSRNIIGQLALNVTPSEAVSELRAIWPALQQQTVPSWLPPNEQQLVGSQRVEIVPIGTGFSTLRLRFGNSVVLLVVLTGILLVIACANLAGLLLARTLARRNQFAILLALGASKGSLVSRVIIESVLLALAGLIASFPFAILTAQSLSRSLSFGRATPLIQSLTPTSNVLWGAAGVTIIIGCAIGIVPALRAAAAAANEDFRGRGVSAGLGLPGKVLLTAQVSLSMVLLVGAGLFSGSLSELRDSSTGLHADSIAFTRLARIPGERGSLPPTYWQALLSELAQINGVRSAALSVSFPGYFEFPESAPTDLYRTRKTIDTDVSALSEFTSPGFFDTVGISRLKGRDFTWADNESAPLVAVVNRAMAERNWSDGDVVGKTIGFQYGAETKQLLIIGVVENAPIGALRETNRPVVFRPLLQEPARAQFPMAHIRYEGDLRLIGGGFAKAVDSQGVHFIRAVFGLSDWIDSALMKERMLAALSVFFGALTLALACIGVYAMLAYSVNLRKEEIAVRLAIGATPRKIATMILRDGLFVGVPGIILGLLGALSTAGVVRSTLYGIKQNDPTVLILASLLFGGTIVLASLLPALRALRSDPAALLRRE